MRAVMVIITIALIPLAMLVKGFHYAMKFVDETTRGIKSLRKNLSLNFFQTIHHVQIVVHRMKNLLAIQTGYILKELTCLLFQKNAVNVGQHGMIITSLLDMQI